MFFFLSFFLGCLGFFGQEIIYIIYIPNSFAQKCQPLLRSHCTVCRTDSQILAAVFTKLLGNFTAPTVANSRVETERNITVCAWVVESDLFLHHHLAVGAGLLPAGNQEGGDEDVH